MEKEKYIGKEFNIEIKRNGKSLFYKGTITDISKYHIWFTDKFTNPFLYKIKDVVQLCPV